MFITSLKNSISSLKLAKKATVAIFNDASFSSLISEHFSSERPKNLVIASNIHQAPKSIYLTTLKELLQQNDNSPNHIQAVALKFQKILSLELEQHTIERLLNRQHADPSYNLGGTYDIFPHQLVCQSCQTLFKISYDFDKNVPINITNTPTICTLWSRARVLKNFRTVGNIVQNPFKSTKNAQGYLISPINLATIYNGNHSTNVALYENNTILENMYQADISSWMQEIHYNPKTNTFDHLPCNAPASDTPLFHENIGHIYEIGQFLYLNQLTIPSNYFHSDTIEKF